MSEALDITAALVRTSGLIVDVCATVAAAHDLTPQQAQLLCVVADRRATMAQLAVLMRITKSSATGIIDRAEESGLVRRESDHLDRRLQHVRLTKRGDELGASYREAVTAWVQAMVDGIDGSTTEVIRTGLSEIVLNNQARLTWPETVQAAV